MTETSTKETVTSFELRMCNYIKYYDEVVQVYGVRGIYVIIVVEENGEAVEKAIAFSAFEPIPLTPELLEKIGLADCEDFGGDSTYLRADDNGELYLVCDFVGVSEKPIKYLHQLQNLYFALTGEEIQINL